MPAPPKHVSVGYPCGDMHTGTRGPSITGHEPHSTDTCLAVAQHTGPRSVARTHRHSARSTWHVHELTLSDSQKHTHEHGCTPAHHHRGAHAHSHTLTDTQRYTHAWQCLGTYLVITLGGELATGTFRGEARDAAPPPPAHETPPPPPTVIQSPDVNSAEAATFSPSPLRHTQSHTHGYDGYSSHTQVHVCVHTHTDKMLSVPHTQSCSSGPRCCHKCDLIPIHKPRQRRCGVTVLSCPSACG